ncbi:MAG: PDGLE domain-containing protein [Desulfobulbaceae bacterium]|nr:PDGLE domain-containing protein [Desulfobulbaceae bacterium]
MKIWQIFLFLALILALFFSPFAATSPDGLETVAIDYGFMKKGEVVLFTSPFPDYLITAITNKTLSTALCGVIGTGATFILALIFGLPLRLKKH